MKGYKFDKLQAMMMTVVIYSPLAITAPADSAAEEKLRQVHQKSTAIHHEIRLQALAANPPAGRTVQEAQRQSLLKQAAIRKDARRQVVAERDAARRAEAARLVMERTAKNH